MPNWKKLIQSGSSAELSSVTASNGISASLIKFGDGSTIASAEGIGGAQNVFTSISSSYGIGFSADSTSDTLIFSASNNIWISASDDTIFISSSGGGGEGSGFPFSGSADLTGSMQLTGSIIISGTATTPLNVEGKVSASNYNIGTPSSNAWKTNLEGSYFDNFNQDTDTAEIVRFMAGLLSASAANPLPNSRYYNSLTLSQGTLNGWTQVYGYLPQNWDTNNATLKYLNTKGFLDIGSQPFSGISVKNSTSWYARLNANTDSNTWNNVGTGYNYFNLGIIQDANTPKPFRVSASISMSFSDNSTEVPVSHSSEEWYKEVTSFGATSHDNATIYVNKINTDNPSVIPPAYQDGDFSGVGRRTRLTVNGNISESDLSSSGYYTYDGRAGISTGSQSTYNFKDVNETTHFYSPLTSADISNNSIAFNTTFEQIVCTSRSLSGAPYLTVGCKYRLQATSSGAFTPLYWGTTTFSSITDPSDSPMIDVDIDDSGGLKLVSLNAGDVNTQNAIYNGNTARNSGHPSSTDTLRMEATYSLSGNGTTNSATINASATKTSMTATVSQTKWKSDTSTTSPSVDFHTAGAFGKVAASGSMRYYGRVQGYDGGTHTDDEEKFTGEDYRLKVDSAIVDFDSSTAAWPTTQQEDNILTAYDLQIKPKSDEQGFLFNPGTSQSGIRYWYPSGFGNADKFYIRKFKKTTTISNLAVKLWYGNSYRTLRNWTSTTEGWSCAVLFESTKKNSSDLPTGATRCRIFDFSDNSAAIITDNQGADDRLNPFGGGNITIGGNPLLSLSGGTYTMAVDPNLGQYMDGSSNRDEFYIIVRFRDNGNNSSEYIDKIGITYS